MISRVLPITLAVSIASTLCAQKMSLNEADRRSAAIIDDATSETEQAINQLVLPEGIEASLWAAEPLLANPVAFDFDEQGRLFVAETYRYGTSVLDIRAYMDMLEEDMAFRTVEARAQGIEELFGPDARGLEIESDRVRLLQDQDGDGKADFSSIYAEGLDSTLSGIASGVLARKDEIWVTSIPDLLKLEGISSEGKATSRKSIHHGFGVHFGYTGHDLHGLIIGPDGKLYFSIGDRGTSVETQEGHRIEYPDTGAVFRCNLDGSDLEVVHYGLRNPQELAFDEFGNLFTADNDCDNGDYERMVQIAEGGDSGWRIGHQHAPLGNAGVWMSEGWWETRFEGRTKFALPPLFYIEDGPSGIAYYPGTGLSPEYKGHLFVTHFKGSIATSGVYTYTFEPDGASYKLKKKDLFLKGILPTDVTFAPDGKFYVLDWVNGWPKSNKGRVYALGNPDTIASPIVSETQSLIAEGMTERSDKELAGLLSHPNWTIRLEAQLELADHGASSIETFTTIATDSSSELYARLHATWGLGILADRGFQEAATEISALARDSEPEVRAQATKLIGDHGIAKDFDLLLAYLKDDSARVRYFAAQSLGKLGNPAAAEALIEAARVNDSVDAYLEHAIVMGLVGSNNADVLEDAIDDSSKAVRLATILAYRRLGDANVAAFLTDSDKEVVFEAARAINDAPIVEAYPALAASLQSPFASDAILANRAINAHFRLGQAENAKALAAYAANNDAPESFRLEALKQIATWANPLQRDRIVGVFLPLEAHDATVAANALVAVSAKIFQTAPGTVQSEFIAAANALDAKGLSDALYALVLDEKKDGSARVAAFNSLNKQNDSRMGDLIIAASQSNASELRMATLPLVAERSPEQAEITLGLMVKGSMEEQRVAYDALASTQQPFAARLLAESLARLAKNEVPVAAQLELLEATENHPNPIVQTAFAAYKAAVAQDPDPTAPFRFALEGGDGRPGRNVFFNNQVMACVRCHIVYGPGTAAGPNLSDVGLRLKRRELLESVVATNAAIADGFDNVILTLTNGETKVGLVEKENDASITLKLASGESETLAKSKISKRDSMPSSMPNIFGTMLSRKDLRDVVEFLARQRTDLSGRSTHGGEEH